MFAGFGDTVRIVESPETSDEGISGRVGVVLGWTTPSITNVNVIGSVAMDYALNVDIEGIDTDIWINPELVEFIDHGAGQTITLHGVDKKWVRSESGEWVEHDLGRSKPWWKFW